MHMLTPRPRPPWAKFKLFETLLILTLITKLSSKQLKVNG